MMVITDIYNGRQAGVWSIGMSIIIGEHCLNRKVGQIQFFAHS